MSTSSIKTYTKKAHKKSRNGCLTCRSRKIKCDETHPSCKNCTRKNLSCLYGEKFIPKTGTALARIKKSKKYCKDSNSDELVHNDFPNGSQLLSPSDILDDLPMNNFPGEVSSSTGLGNSSLGNPSLGNPNASFEFDDFLEYTSLSELFATSNQLNNACDSYDPNFNIPSLLNSSMNMAYLDYTSNSNTCSPASPLTSSELVLNESDYQKQKFDCPRDEAVAVFKALDVMASLGGESTSVPVATGSETGVSSISDFKLEYNSIDRNFISDNCKQAMTLSKSYLSDSTITIKLMHYFSKIYYKKLPTYSSKQKSWFSLFSYFGLEYDHVLHMLLAVSVLDLYNLKIYTHKVSKDDLLNLTNDEDYLKIAQQHSSESLRKLQNNLCKTDDDMSKKSSTAVVDLATSLANLLYIFLNPLHKLGDSIFYNMSKLIREIFMKNSFVISTKKFEYQSFNNATVDWYSRNIGLTNLFVKSKSEVQMSFLPVYLFGLVNLTTFNIYDSYDDNETQSKLISDAQQKSIYMLFAELINLGRKIDFIEENEPDLIRVLLRWPVSIPCSFIESLAQRNPISLIIVAHYIMFLCSNYICAVSNGQFKEDYFDEIFKNEISYIDDLLDYKWKPWIDVPKRVVGLL
ncbi:hypothetical protein PACTADRAFT_33885 [Pachysolen tannophilus NRRL Y-2460]|uniref:Zn(2)-C6 fungal-type domain-containing protein n=1 Tax=Pachysolen tannophilus NRRL Y-2460 TaxID=669874 RepID=A0A1E4TU82_PACTA|nr:hypothetical protein PACTADRAFT_33885 [Pachysolen tannophilus NRRL Y-2460]